MKPLGRFRSKRAIYIAPTVVVLLIVVAIAGFAIHNANQARLEIERIAAEEQRIAEKEAREAKRAARLQEAQRQEQERVAAQERLRREQAIASIESSIKVMAEDHAARGQIEGPVLHVTCDPVAGGSTDDLNQLTTVFSCFAATIDNEDGTFTGYRYNATANWESGNYTYSFGAP